MEYVIENPKFISDEELLHPDSISSLFAAEDDYQIALNGDAVLSARHVVASLVHKFTPTLGEFVVYLATNYVDRFLSYPEIPMVKPGVAALLSIACVSLAAKMMKNGFSLPDLQGTETPMFTAKMIERMEMVVLSTLRWRMRSITPFAFLDFFVASFPVVDATLRQRLRNRASENLILTQKEGKFLEFKPSAIAASAALTAAFELFPIHFLSFRSAVLSCEFIDKEKSMACCDAMLAAKAVPKKPGLSSPVTVLGHCDSERTTASSLDNRATKKSRLS